MTFIEFVNAWDTARRHNTTMGWVYGITWALDADDAAVSARPKPPVPTGAAYNSYNPTSVGSDPPDKQQQAFDEGARKGMDVIAYSSLTEERKEVAAQLTRALATAIQKLGYVGGHKYFVTQLFRNAYKDGDFNHRDKWSLDWPKMQVESIGS
jgi:hypothetical protein